MFFFWFFILFLFHVKKNSFVLSSHIQYQLALNFYAAKDLNQNIREWSCLTELIFCLVYVACKAFWLLLKFWLPRSAKMLVCCSLPCDDEVKLTSNLLICLCSKLSFMSLTIKILLYLTFSFYSRSPRWVSPFGSEKILVISYQSKALYNTLWPTHLSLKLVWPKPNPHPTVFIFVWKDFIL